MSEKENFFSKWASGILIVITTAVVASCLSHLRQEGSLSIAFSKWCWEWSSWEVALAMVFASVAFGAVGAWVLSWIERWEKKRRGNDSKK